MKSRDIEVISTNGALGAEIAGIDLRHPLSEQLIGRIRQALLDHCVIFFRKQNITEEQQVRFTGYFGPPEEHVREQDDRPVKEIFIISNVRKDGRPIGALGNEEVDFHSDLSYLRKPGTLSLLYAVEVPSTGGATQWINCYRAYDELEEELKQRLKGLRAVHRHPVETQNPPQPVDHPVVRTHPETSRKSLYVSPHMTQSIRGVGQTESRDLLERLFRHLTQPRFIWTHDWQVGDLVVWDNRPTMHRRQYFPPTERRIMKRTQIFGQEIPQE